MSEDRQPEDGSQVSDQSREIITQLSQVSEFMKTLSQAGPIHDAAAQRIATVEQRLAEAGKREKKLQADLAEMRKALGVFDKERSELIEKLKTLEETVARMEDHPEVKARKAAEKKALKDALEREIAELEGKGREEKAPEAQPKIKVQ